MNDGRHKCPEKNHTRLKCNISSLTISKVQQLSLPVTLCRRVGLWKHSNTLYLNRGHDVRGMHLVGNIGSVLNTKTTVCSRILKYFHFLYIYYFDINTDFETRIVSRSARRASIFFSVVHDGNRVAPSPLVQTVFRCWSV